MLEVDSVFVSELATGQSLVGHCISAAVDWTSGLTLTGSV